MGIMAVVAAGRLSFERVASSIARRARKPYSKQALQKRLQPSVARLFIAILGRCLQPALKEAITGGIFATFNRVLLHDSSTIALPERYAKDFPGSANQCKSCSLLKIQVVCDLLKARVEHLSISGFTRNDQRAAPDILALLQPGDLVIRDLGYFVLSVFSDIIQRKAFFLSRYRHETLVMDPLTHRPISLGKVLKQKGFIDAQVLLGAKANVPVRLVAVAVPPAVANQRRRKLRQNRDQALNPSQEHFFLLGWNIFITNVDPQVWSASQIPAIYRLRWRIETIFKAWKSCLSLSRLSDQCLSMICLSVITKLIFCAFVYRTCHHIETTVNPHCRHASLIRVASILSSMSICLEAAFVNLSPQQLLAQLIDKHAFYETRHDRRNFANDIAIAISH